MQVVARVLQLPDMPVAEAAAVYMRDCESPSAHTNKARRGDLALFSAYLEAIGVPTMREVTSAHLRSFVAERAAIESPVTASRRAYIVKSFCRWVRAQFPELRDPTFGLRLPKPKKLDPLGFEPEEIEAIKTACSDPRDLAIIEVFHRTGLRCHELVALDWRHLDMARWYLVNVQGKHFRYLDKFLHESARRALLAYLPIRDEVLRQSGVSALTEEMRGRYPLFVSTYQQVAGEPESYRLADKSVYGIVKRAGERVGIDDAHPHRLRHTACYEFYKATNDIALTQQFMGHQSASVTMRYLKRSNKHIEAAIGGMV